MDEFDVMSLLGSEISKDVNYHLQQNLSDSPLDDRDKLRLMDKLRQMHWKTMCERNMKVLMPLFMGDLVDACLANNIYISTIRGMDLTDIIKKVDEDSRLWEDKALVNFIFREEPKLDEIGKLYEALENHSDLGRVNWGAAIDKDASNMYCLDVLSYK